MKLLNRIFKSGIAICCLAAIALAPGCSESESYSDLLKDEEKTVNWYLSGENVLLDIPENSDFITGDNAPFYKMNEEGTVYMRVIRKGDMAEDQRPQTGDKVYFRFSRRNLQQLKGGIDAPWAGNSDDLTNALGPTSFIYGNRLASTSAKFGTGVQLPLDYLGYNSEVMLVLKASMGFSEEASACIPFLYKIRYFKAEY